MGKNQRIIGDEHVKNVYQALKHFIKGQSIEHCIESAKQTAYYIINLYPNIKSVSSKFDTEVPDMNNDLILYVNNDRITINLFYIKKGSRIQPKNPGAKSFFAKYFLSEK